MLFLRRARERLESTEARLRAEGARRNRTQAEHLRRQADKFSDPQRRQEFLELARLADLRSRRYDVDS